MAPQDSGAAAVRSILTRLGKHRGLVGGAERLRKSVIDIGPLLDLEPVRKRAYRDRVPPEEAVLLVVRELARQLPPTERLIADAALSLELLAARPPATLDLTQFYGTDLGKRREFLNEHWSALLAHLGVESIPDAPSVRSLRDKREHHAVTQLARLLTSETDYAGTLYELDEPADAGVRQRASRTARGVITVVGAAVIDHIYRTDHLPTVGGPAARGRFEEQIGGKGFNRAVAAARLGFQVRLLTAVGDDENGRKILRQLAKEKVDTELVRVLRGLRTPVAAMIIAGGGGIGTIGSIDDAVRLSENDLNDPAAQEAITESDALLLTFEQPISVLEKVFRMIRPVADPPWLLVQPTPSLDRPQYLYQYFDQIDYLLGTRRELGSLLATGEQSPPGDPESVAQQLVAMGVDTVCTVEGFQCAARSARTAYDLPRPAAAHLDESPGARAAFTAALAARLLVNERSADRDDFVYATAAMAATQSFGDVASAMPPATKIDDIVNFPANGTDGH
ncbi:carbohydrate kinase family protein [Nocardia sp. NPDC127579]|uniref:carbohydrate kinase family protein n=1 Tax=Nocardia sp. NPDC127579 TaxID=3345402 RepID=UPI0036343D49